MGKVNLGDNISGNLESVASETLLNETRNEKIKVYIQDYHCDRQTALRMMSGN
jgi:hypothetical protein